jgi:endo-1,4-beta-xylanase
LRDHIMTVAGHYAGKMHSWDVVNEVVLPSDQQPDGLRNSPWLQLLGSKYIDLSFRITAAADPHALLVLNQNHLEYDSNGNQDCRVATLNLLKQLKSSGTPVHALGIQAHLSQDEGSLNVTILRDFLHDVASLDLKIMITELDVSDQNLPYDMAARDSMVAQQYQEFLTAVLEEPAVIAVITWGLSDKYTWLTTYKPRPDKALVRPLPLDDKFQRKLSWSAIATAFDKFPRR